MPHRQDQAFSRQPAAAPVTAGGATGGHKQSRRLPECLRDNVLAQATEERRRGALVFPSREGLGGRGGWGQPRLQPAGDGGVRDAGGARRGAAGPGPAGQEGGPCPRRESRRVPESPAGVRGAGELAESQRSTSASSVVPPDSHTATGPGDGGAAPQTERAEINSCEIPKKNCTWLMVTHETCVKDDVMTALEKATGDVVLKFEPFVLHVLCQELQDAQLLHSVAVDSGFRNSGITVGRGGKIMMAVRSTHCLEVPLSHKGKLMVSEEYIEFLIHVANRKMEENTRRIDRFYKRLELALKTAISADNSPSEETEKNRSVYVHRRKRKTIQEQDVHTVPKDHNEELEPADDTESNLDIFAEIMI
ncbi:tRNA wybutosine-synthesizing protein 3 homolog isoform 1-T1 [Ciconia maguari]